MTSKIIAGTSAGSALVLQSDTSGALEIQTGAVPTTAMTVSAAQAVSYPGSVTFNGTATFAGTPSFPTALPVASGGTGLTATPTNGQLDIGNGTGFTRAALTAGTGVSVTNGVGSVTLANTGVTSLVAGTGISVSGATGAVTVTNTVAPFAGISSQIFTSSGTFTIPSGITKLKVSVAGGGGGGTGQTSYFDGSGGFNDPATAGTFAGAAIKYLTGLTPSATLTITIGGGGSAGGSGGTSSTGGAGGTSSVASGTQAISTISATGGGSSTFSAGIFSGGGGGTSSGGDISYFARTNQGPSLFSYLNGTGRGGGGNGSAAGTAGLVLIEF